MGQLAADEINLRIVINGNSAKKELGELDMQSQKLQAEIRKLKAEGKDFIEQMKELEQVNRRADALRKQLGLSGMTMKQLSQEASRLKLILNNLTPGTTQYKEYEERLNGIKNRMSELRGGGEKAGVSFARMTDNFNKYFGIITAIAASMTGLVIGFKSLVDKFNKFEETLANLSSLTGLAGSDLQYLSNKAQELSISTDDAGIKITKSATDIVDAYTLMGSAKPELLKSKEALNAVTKDAIILSEAAKMELKPAVDSLANTMNQFSAKASESSRYINVLAAGSKEGAVAIPDISEAIIKFGAAANSANVSVEESVSLIETLGEKGIKGAEAGTALKNVLLTLQTGADDTNPAIVGLQTALENLRNKKLSATEMTKLFGKEGYIAGQILVDNTEKVKYYTKAVTDTSVATEQARINTNTNAASLAQAKNKFELVAIELGQKLAPAMTFSTNAFSYFIKALMAAPKFIKDNQIMLISLAGAFIILNAEKIKTIALSVKEKLIGEQGILTKIKETVVTKAQAVAEIYRASMIEKTTIAQKAAAIASATWRSALTLLGGPLGMITLAITGLIAGIKAYDKYNADAVRREKEKQAVINSGIAINEFYARSIAAINDQLQKLNRLTVEEKKELSGKIDLQVKELELAIRKYELQQLQIKADNTQSTLWQKTKNYFASGFDMVGTSLKNAEDAINNGKEAAASMDEALNKMKETMKSLKTQQTDLKDIMNAEKIADAIKGDSYTALQEKLNKYTEARNNAKIGSEDYIRIQNKMTAVEKELANQSNTTTAAITKDNKKQKESYQDLNNEIKKLQEERLLRSMKDYEKEVFHVKSKYAKLKEQAKGNADQINELEDLEADELKALKDKNDQELLEQDEKNLLEAEQKLQEIIKDEKDKILAVIEENYLQQQIVLENQLNNGLLTQQQYNDKQLALEIAHQASIIAVKKKAGDSTSQEELKLIQLKGQTTKKQKGYDDEQTKSLLKKNESELAGIAETSAAAMENAKSNEEMAKAFVGIVKKEIKASIIKATAQVVGNTLVQTPFPLNIALAAAAGAAVGGLFQAIVPNFAEGNYPVIGLNDGKEYNAKRGGNAQTGFVNQPTLLMSRSGQPFLVGENNVEEMVIDGPTLKNPMVANLARIITQIKHNNRVPNFAQGNYPVSSNNNYYQNDENEGVKNTLKDLSSTVGSLKNVLSALQEKGLNARIHYEHLTEELDKNKQIENDTKLK